MATNKKPKHQTQRKMSKQEQAFCNLKLHQMGMTTYKQGFRHGVNTVVAIILWNLHTKPSDPWGHKRLAELFAQTMHFMSYYMENGKGEVSLEDVVAQLKEECGIEIDLSTGDFNFGAVEERVSTL